MRVNARFLGVSERQVDYLVKTTGLSVSEVLREAVSHYYQDVRGGDATGLRHFSRHVGAYRSGDSTVSARYKDLLTEGLLAKHVDR